MRSPLVASVLAFSFLVGCGGAAANTPGADSAGAPKPDSASGSASGVRFSKKPPSVGSVSVSREHNETKLDMDITVDGKVQHSTNATIETIERRVEVLAVGPDGAATRLKVSYAVNHQDDTSKGLVASPVEGKTYVVEGHGDKSPSSVKDAAGNPASAAEAAVVANDFKHLGRLDPAWRGLPDRPLAAGDSMDEMAKAMLADDASDGLEDVQIHFEGPGEANGRPAGVFNMQLTGKVSPDSPRVKLGGKFTLLLENGREVVSDATAPLEINQTQTKNGSTVSVVARGTLHIHKETTYEGS
jgi:hypothetical protein